MDIEKEASKKLQDHLLNANEHYKDDARVFMAYWMCITDCEISIDSYKKQNKIAIADYYNQLLKLFRNQLLEWCKKHTFIDK